MPFRPTKTKAAYELIWEDDGSPLINNSKKIAEALQNRTGWNVNIAMRYQNPSIKDAILKCKDNAVKELIVCVHLQEQIRN